MLATIASLFTRNSSKTPAKATRTRSSTRVQLGVERLEERESPAGLSFGTAFAAGAVTIPSLTANYYSLRNASASGDLVKTNTGGMGTASAHLGFSNVGSTIRLELQSNVNTGNYTSGQARTNTTQNPNGGPGWVTVNVVGGPGDYAGRPVKITVSASYTSTIGAYSTGSNFVQIGCSGYTSNGGNLLAGSDNTQGTHTYPASITFYSRVGSSFSIIETTVSSGYGKGSVAIGTATMTISAQSV